MGDYEKVVRELVAPFTGAWIEIVLVSVVAVIIRVAPFTGAWIEIRLLYHSLIVVTVAPFTGAWIEIPGWIAAWLAAPVAPFTGAWIEMRKGQSHMPVVMSLPSRERGLKLV